MLLILNAEIQLQLLNKYVAGHS